MNLRRGFQRIALVYLVLTSVSIIGAAVSDLSQVNCPSSYTIRAADLRANWFGQKAQEKREAIEGKCRWLIGNARERALMAEAAIERLGISRTTDMPLRACTADELDLGPVPIFVDTSYVQSHAEVWSCRADPSNWRTTIAVAVTALAIPIFLSVVAGIGYGLFRLGQWVHRGFKQP